MGRKPDRIRARVEEEPSSSVGLVGQRLLREQVLDILDEIGIPVCPRVISEIAAARYERSLSRASGRARRAGVVDRPRLVWAQAG
jgi:hypothetical protein